MDVRVTPGDAGFFAGERLEATVTFANPGASASRSGSLVSLASSRGRAVPRRAHVPLNDQLDPAVRDDVTRRLGEEAFSAAPSSPSQPRGEQRLLWAYAQLSGAFSIDDALLKPFDFDLVKQSIAQGTVHTDVPRAGFGPAVGGGELIPPTLSGAQAPVRPAPCRPEEDEMDPLPPTPLIPSNLASADPIARLGMGAPSQTRSVEEGKLYARITGYKPPVRRARIPSISGLEGLHGPRMSEPRVEDGWTAYLRNRLTLGRHSSPSVGAASFNRHHRTGSTLADKAVSAVLSQDIPVISMPPSVLCVDLIVLPGEEKSFKLSIPLPPDLPPSYDGTVLSFTYTLSICTNLGPYQRTRMMEIPIRVFPHVTPSCEMPCWDLLNPIIWLKEHATVTPVPEAVTPPGESRDGLEAFARSLLLGTDTPLISADLAPSKAPCAQLAEEIALWSPKVSFDIAKDGNVAATLTLPHSSYRLGDAISGVLSLNPIGDRMRVVRALISLEACEHVHTDLSRFPAATMRQLSTKVYDTVEESVLDIGRWPFDLILPPAACAAFTSTVLRLQYTLHLSLLILTRPQPVDPDHEKRHTSWIGSFFSTPTKSRADGGHVPPPHLVPCFPDGLEAYHERLRGVPALVGPVPPFDSESFASWCQKQHIGWEGKLEIVECSLPISVLPARTQEQGTDVRFVA